MEGNKHSNSRWFYISHKLNQWKVLIQFNTDQINKFGQEKHTSKESS